MPKATPKKKPVRRPRAPRQASIFQGTFSPEITSKLEQLADPSKHPMLKTGEVTATLAAGMLEIRKGIAQLIGEEIAPF